LTTHLFLNIEIERHHTKSKKAQAFLPEPLAIHFNSSKIAELKNKISR
jgi:hypothetical protein